MVLSVLSVVYFSLGLTAAEHSGCIKVNRCKCLMRDGSGLIDLSSVADEDGFIQRLKPLASAWRNTDVLLSFSPCLPFSEPEDFSGTACTDVAACVVIRSDQITYNESLWSRYQLAEAEYPICCCISEPHGRCFCRVHQDNRFIDQYLNYGRHEDNTFSYNDSKKSLTVSYSSKYCTESLTHDSIKGF